MALEAHQQRRRAQERPDHRPQRQRQEHLGQRRRAPRLSGQAAHGPPPAAARATPPAESLEHRARRRRWREQVAEPRPCAAPRSSVLPSKSGVIFEELGLHLPGPLRRPQHRSSMIEIFRKARRTSTGRSSSRSSPRRAAAANSPRPTRPSSTAPAPYDPATGELKKKPGAPPNYQDVFGDALVELARRDPTIVGITAAMAEGTSLNKLQKALPGSLLRRGHRRAARRDLRGGPGVRRACAGRGDLLDVPAARLRSGHPRCLRAEPARRLPDRPRRAGRRGWPHAAGRFDIAFMRMIPEYAGDGAEGRERAAPHALHRALHGWAGLRCATRAAAASACRWMRSSTSCPSARPSC